MMHQHNLPLDYPEFVRARQNVINASDVSTRVLQILSSRFYHFLILFCATCSLNTRNNAGK